MMGAELNSCTLGADTQGSWGTKQPDSPQPGSAAKAPEQQQHRGSSAAAPEQQQQQRGSSTAKAPEEQPSSAAEAGAPGAQVAPLHEQECSTPANSSNHSTEWARFRRRCSAKRFKVQFPGLASRWESKDKRAGLFQDFLQNDEGMAKVELVHKRRVVNQTRARRKFLNKTE